MNAKVLVVAVTLILAIGAYMWTILIGSPFWISLILAACVVMIFFIAGGKSTIADALIGVGIIAFAYPIMVLTGSYTLQAIVLIVGIIPLRMAWGIYRKREKESSAGST